MGTARQNSCGRIGINAHLLSNRLGYRRAGIHHYIARLLNHVTSGDSGLRFTVFTNQVEDLSLGSAATVVTSRWPTARRTFRIMWEQLVWPWSALRLKLDLLHSLAFVTPIATPCPTIVTVYDLSFIHYPERFPALQHRYLSGQTRRSCRQAKRVVAISESGRQDIHRFFGVPQDRIEVVYPGVDPRFFPRPAGEIEVFRRQRGLPAGYVLHVGTLQPRKNISTVLEAFVQLGRPDLELVLVGGKGWLYEEIFTRVRELDLEGRVRFAGYVPDADLPLWYNAAAVLAFPSVYEGFGLPIVQAMACGTPVIAARTSSVPEVTGQAARLVEPEDPRAWAEQLATVLDDEHAAAAMKEAGLAQARLFSWPEAGRKMLDVYHRVLAER